MKLLKFNDYSQTISLTEEFLHFAKQDAIFESEENKSSKNSKKYIKDKYPKKGTAEYKARMDCLMSEKTAEECNKPFPVVKKTFTTSYEFKNVEPEVKKEIEKSEKLKYLMDEESRSLNSDPIHVDA
jgi:hypothetical protein